jgi:myosin-5
MGFDHEMIQDIMRLIVAILYAGNMSFTETNHGENCILVKDEASLAVASLLGVSYEKLAASLTSRVLFLREGNIIKELNSKQAYKAAEGLIKAVYGANFDYIVEVINRSIHTEDRHSRNYKRGKDSSASIGVLDIFGFETFDVNNFEQLCINYTNEHLQQHFNQHVFKMEQQEYEREGILWKFISFPDNQDVLDLIDMKRVGILAVLDEQCIVEWGSDDIFVQQLYTLCGPHDRFEATAQQKPDCKFSIEHYAGPVEYSTDDWVEKNKDQLPAASVELLMSSNLGYIGKLQASS